VENQHSFIDVKTRILTETADEKWDEVPCSMPEHLPHVNKSGGGEDDDKYGGRW